MNLKFIVKTVTGTPWASFPEEERIRGMLLILFLEDAREYMTSILDEISAAKQNKEIVTKFRGDHVEVKFTSEKITIEEVHPINPIYGSQNTDISIEEAEQLLKKWQKALKEWEAENGQFDQ